MTSFTDLNLGAAGLEKQALALGFSYAKPAKSVFLESPKDLKQASGSVVAVESKSVDLLKAAFKRDFKALLVNPYSVDKFFNDDGLVRALKQASEERACAFEIPVAFFLSSKHVFRARFIGQTRAFLKRCLKFRAPFVFTSRACSEWDLKSPREVIAIGVFHGLSYEQAANAIGARPASLLEELK